MARKAASAISGFCGEPMTMPDGYEKKFQPSKWTSIIQSDEKFRTNVLKLMDEEVVQKFDKRLGNASEFYGGDEGSTT